MPRTVLTSWQQI